MRILLLSDTHLRYRPPAGRCDSFFDTQLKKMVQVMDIYKEEKCGLLLQAGDLWDRFNPPYVVMSTYIELLKSRDVHLHTVLGQHDMVMHSMSSVHRSATRVLVAAGVATILDNVPVKLSGVCIYGASFGQTIPKAEIPKPACKILVVHMLVGTEDLWGKDTVMRPVDWAKRYPGWDLVLFGDYHYRFIKRAQGVVMVNTGCLVRLKRNETAHEPGVVVYDTETGKTDTILLDVRPADQVFTEAPVSKVEDFSDLIEQLRSGEEVATSFADGLDRYFRDNSGEREQVKDLVFKALPGVTE